MDSPGERNQPGPKEQLLTEAMGYLYYYNNLREHSSLEYQSPYEHLTTLLPELDDNIRYVVPILLGWRGS